MSETKVPDQYLLLFRSIDWYAGLPEEKVQEIVTNWMDWYRRLVAEGVVEGGRPLAGQGKVVGGKDGAVISDGPFAEAKETVGGYFIVNAKTIDEAVIVAKGCPGLPYGVRVEVRPLLETCHAAKDNDALKLAAALA